MITLYNVPVSSYGAKVRIILAHKGIEWTELARRTAMAAGLSRDYPVGHRAGDHRR